MIVTRWSQLSPRTKAIIITAVAATTASQVDAVKNAVLPKLVGHPHIYSIAYGLLFIAGLLVKPEVRELLGIKQEEKKVTDPATGALLSQQTTTEVVALPEGTDASGIITTTNVTPKE